MVALWLRVELFNPPRSASLLLFPLECVPLNRAATRSAFSSYLHFLGFSIGGSCGARFFCCCYLNIIFYLCEKERIMKLKEEFTTKMHSELRVGPRVEVLNRCITLWCYCGIRSEDDPRFADLCKQYGLTRRQALKNKMYCLSLLSPVK